MPVEKTGNKPPPPTDEELNLDQEVDFDDIYGGNVGYEDENYGQPTGSKPGYTGPAGGSKNLGVGGGGVSPYGDPGSQNPDAAYQQAKNQVQQWKAQGKSPEQIQQLLQNQGWPAEDAYYLSQGGGYTPYGQNGYPNKYMQYGTGGAKYNSWQQGGDLQKFMQDSQMLNEAKGMQRSAKKQAAEQKMKIHMILLQILMGDIVGALRSYAVLMDRDMRQFTRMIVDKLDKVRKARSTVIRNFARTKPPRAYAGQNPSQAARAQDRSAKYTQFVQMSTQLMNELQNTERELVDALQSMHRNMQTFWESYAGFRDQEFRTNERVMTTR